MCHPSLAQAQVLPAAAAAAAVAAVVVTLVDEGIHLRSVVVLKRRRE